MQYIVDFEGEEKDENTDEELDCINEAIEALINKDTVEGVTE